MKFARFASLALAVLPVCLACPQAFATTYTGTFGADNTVQPFTFTSTSTQNYTFYTTSYGGGTNMNGTVSSAGGFVPVLTLFTASGTVIGSDGGDGTCSGSSKVDATTKMCDDAFLTETLSAGSYILELTEFPNVAIGSLSDGFLFASDPTATGDLCGVSGGTFLETDTASCTQRTNAYAVNIAATSPVPEPATWVLVLPAFAALFYVEQRRRQLF